MVNTSPKITRSVLSQEFFEGDLTVQVEIYRVDDANDWILEVIDEDGVAVMWSEFFESDSAAMARFAQELREQGLADMLDLDDDDIETLH